MRTEEGNCTQRYLANMEIPRRRDRALREGHRAADPRQAAAAATRPPQGRRALPALRRDDRGRPLRGLRHVLLPGRADGRQGAQGSPAFAAVEVVCAPPLSRPVYCAVRATFRSAEYVSKIGKVKEPIGFF